MKTHWIRCEIVLETILRRWDESASGFKGEPNSHPCQFLLIPHLLQVSNYQVVTPAMHLRLVYSGRHRHRESATSLEMTTRKKIRMSDGLISLTPRFPWTVIQRYRSLRWHVHNCKIRALSAEASGTFSKCNHCQVRVSSCSCSLPVTYTIIFSAQVSRKSKLKGLQKSICWLLLLLFFGSLISPLYRHDNYSDDYYPKLLDQSFHLR